MTHEHPFGDVPRGNHVTIQEGGVNVVASGASATVDGIRELLPFLPFRGANAILVGDRHSQSLPNRFSDVITESVPHPTRV
jgi:hypothetical protein